ncbi:MAG: O-antigen ligase family protein [Candidatus Zixiibacteriota bacterium]|nr:MAG: O-antigen ligase family protein [candidate division Zixibacteria bacterium]
MADDRLQTSEHLLAGLLALSLSSSTFSVALSQTALGLAAAFYVAIVIAGRVKFFAGLPRWFCITIAAWLVWLVAASLVNEQPWGSLNAVRDNWLFIAIPISIHVIRRGMLWPLLVSLACGVIFVSLVGIWQYFTGSTAFVDIQLSPAPGFGHRATGFFTGLVTFGNYFALAAAGLFGYLLVGNKTISRGMTVFLSVAVFLAFLVTILNFGRGAVVAVILSMGYLLVLCGRIQWKASLVSLGVIAVTLLAIPGVGARFVDQFEKDLYGESEGGRVFIWRNTLKIAEQHPITGVGPANFKKAYIPTLRPDIPEIRKLHHAHSDFLHAAATTGVPGVLFFGAMWFGVIRCFLKGFRESLRKGDTVASASYGAALAATICCLTTSLFHEVFSDDEIRLPLMFFWAVGLAHMYNRAPESGCVSAAQTP